ncbi:MAG: hypothetical protein DA405_03600 [Bacteroidetes bacterium]|jgi:hypothetical protein|nr:MAG: hypothetical protein DA405_03600 [Bacteroidota bacterium]
MKTALNLSFLFLFLFGLSVFLNWPFIALALFYASPIMVIYTIYKVLRHPEEVTQTFEDHFYQDHPYQRNKID